ncbi:hypothetical protein G6F24_016275 [Rhizopus arrhizus]|nr:hypothetical protein G6F24_016275 [Rhizopus arrhizus]
MRVIRPRKLLPSITIATWPRSNTGSRASIGDFTSSRHAVARRFHRRCRPAGRRPSPAAAKRRTASCAGRRWSAGRSGRSPRCHAGRTGAGSGRAGRRAAGAAGSRCPASSSRCTSSTGTCCRYPAPAPAPSSAWSARGSTSSRRPAGCRWTSHRECLLCPAVRARCGSSRRR